MSNKRSTPPKDTPATRKKRLQERLLEISERSDKELSALMKSLDKVKTAFRSNKPQP